MGGEDIVPEETLTGRSWESLHGNFMKAAAVTSCWETIEHCNPDSLAGDSHTGKAGRELGTCWRQLEREETERGGNTMAY